MIASPEGLSVGVWTWLDRWDRQILGQVDLDRVDLDDVWRHRGGPLHVEGLHTHRAWHALHVALTGEEAGGAPPWCHVVWTTPGLRDVTFASAAFHHPAEITREVADSLQHVDFHAAVDTLYAARELGIFVYSFDRWAGDQDMVQCGLFRRVFDDVARFYAAAAAADHVVTIHRC